MEVPKIDSLVTGIGNNAAPSTEYDLPTRQIVAAVHEVNKSELMGEGKQLSFTRDPQTKQRVIQIIDQSSGEVVDQLPPEEVLQLAALLK